MLLLVLGLILFCAITWINIIWGLIKILLFLLLLSVILFIIKSGFYILVFFSVLYLWTKWISCVWNYLKRNNKSEYKKSGRVEFDDVDFVEVME